MRAKLKRFAVAMAARLKVCAAGVAVAIEMRDMCAFGGLALVARGLHEVYSPAAWIVCGIALFWLGVKR